MIDYFKLIHRHIPVETPSYQLYVVHVCLVTERALRIARKMGLDGRRCRFIEEAGMLHDIGICRVYEPRLGCRGQLPYLAHGVVGRQILEAEGLPDHALVAERHVGVGISAREVREARLPLPEQDMLPKTLEEQILTWSDLFYNKVPDVLWEERTLSQVELRVQQYGEGPWRRFQHLKKRILPYDLVAQVE
ncbi:MAG: HD domain-containing protein [Calditrichaeota bacterium]|nr:MAG: HD domain-containing protein [Calditrichota bacterium]